MPQPRTRIPPTGTATLRIDWGQFLSRLPDTPVIASALWTVPADLTEDSSSNSQVATSITISTDGLAIGTAYDLLCTATLSNGDVQTATLPIYVAPLGTEPVAQPPALTVVDNSGGGGAVSSVFGRTGIITAQSGDYTFAQIGAKPTTLAGYGITDAFDGVYSSLSDIPATFAPSAHTQAISTITGLQTALDDKQALDAALTQLSGLAVANGQVVGWSGGVLANISIPGGGDMSKSVYDTDDNGVVDAAASVPWAGVTGTPTTLAGYGITNAVLNTLTLTAGTGLTGGGNLTANRSFSLDAPTLASLALADDAVQRGDFGAHIETFLDSANSAAARAAIAANNATGLTTGTLPDARLSAAVVASLGLADTATQPGDNLSTLTNDSGFITAANLTYTASPTQGIVASDVGTNATLTAATGTNAGLLLPADFSKLAGIETGAEANNISDTNATDLTDGGDTTLHTHQSTSISDSTPTGRALLTATDAAAARTAIGANDATNLDTGTLAVPRMAAGTIVARKIFWKNTAQTTSSIATGGTAAILSWLDTAGVSATPSHACSNASNLVIIRIYASVANSSGFANTGIAITAGGATIATATGGDVAAYGAVSTSVTFSVMSLVAVAFHLPGATSSVVYGGRLVNRAGATSTLYLGKPEVGTTVIPTFLEIEEVQQ